MSKLKPCPFCGSEHVYVSKIKKSVYRVECWCCGASIESCIGEAIKWWNTRAIENNRDELLRIADKLELAKGGE